MHVGTRRTAMRAEQFGGVGGWDVKIRGILGKAQENYKPALARTTHSP